MAVNLLLDYSEKKIKTEKKQSQSIYVVIFWWVLLVLASIFIFLYQGYLNTQKLQVEAQVKEYENTLTEMNSVAGPFYTLAYKLGVYKYIKTGSYIPNPVVTYIKEKTPTGLSISSYTFFGDGGFEIACRATDFLVVVKFWDKLIQDKDRLESMQLKSMSVSNSPTDTDYGEVTFTLRGEVNVDKLSQSGSNE